MLNRVGEARVVGHGIYGVYGIPRNESILNARETTQVSRRSRLNASNNVLSGSPKKDRLIAHEVFGVDVAPCFGRDGLRFIPKLSFRGVQ